MRVQLHFDIKEADGRLWFKRYFVEDFPALPNLYDFVEAASVLHSIEQDQEILNTLDAKIYYVSQVVWLKDDKGIYALIACSEREEA